MRERISLTISQVRFGGRTELATESDERVAFLCAQLEATLSHGLKARPPNRGLAAIKLVIHALVILIVILSIFIIIIIITVCVDYC